MHRKFVRPARVIAFILLMLAPQFFTTSVSALDSDAVYLSYLRGANEVAGGDPDGRGRAEVTFKYGRGLVCYSLTLKDIALPLTGAHIHIGVAGTNGPIVVNFPVDGGANLSDCVAVEGGLIKMIANKPARFYVNVHNAEFPGGAIRGQLIKP